MIKSLNLINKFFILFSIFFLALFGKNFALINIPFAPGFILDFVLLLLLFLSIFLIKKPYLNYFSSKELFILSYYFILVLIHLITAQSRDINELGQDSITVVYPILIYCIYKFSKFRLKINENFVKFSLIFYSIYLILDFTFERSVIVESFLGINLTNVNIPSFNITLLKPTEAMFYLSILVFFFSKYKTLDTDFTFIFPGICFGLYMTDSRTVLYAGIIYIFLLFLENHNNLSFKDFLFLSIGICISFSFVITDSQSLINDQVSLENSDAGIRRIRENSGKCFIENLLIERDKENCEKSQSGFKNFNLGMFIQTEEQGFVTNATRTVIIKFNEIVNLYGSPGNFNNIIEPCFQESTSTASNICDYEALSIYNEYIQIRNNAYDDLCGDNITWRINLWKKTLYNKNSDTLSILFGNGIGYPIPTKLINENNLPIECYIGSQDSISPLRNAHNTYLTFFYRYGLINLILISYLLLLVLKKLFKNKNYSLIVFALIMTSSDPILDSPISLFTFCFLLFYLLDRNETEI